jgi:hypothetical protein
VAATVELELLRQSYRDAATAEASDAAAAAVLSAETERDAARVELSDTLRVLHAEQEKQRISESKHELAAAETAALRAEADTFTNEAKAGACFRPLFGST